MKIDNKGLKLIQSFEGLRLTAYKCVDTEKYYTIGYGHYGPDVKKGMKISKKKAVELLKGDIAGAENYVNRYVKVELTQSMYNALVSFTYNCGGGALKGSTLLKLINQEEYKKAGAEFKKWNKSGGKVLPGLVTRRAKELQEYKRLGYLEKFEIPSLKGYKGFSIVDGLKAYGYDSSKEYRSQVWKALGKTDKYRGTGKQNSKMLTILKTR